MPLALLLVFVFFASFILIMVGLAGGLIFAPLFILWKFPVATAIPASLFSNGIAAFSASIKHLQKIMAEKLKDRMLHQILVSCWWYLSLN